MQQWHYKLLKIFEISVLKLSQCSAFRAEVFWTYYHLLKLLIIYKFGQNLIFIDGKSCKHILGFFDHYIFYLLEC